MPLRLRPILLALLIALYGAGRPAEAAEAPYLLMDVDSGQVLASQAATELWFPASITKLMTAYLVFEALRIGNLKPDSPVRISARALKEPPSKMGYPAGTVITVENALKMMLVHSANDIAMALAEAVGGSEQAFVGEMNAAAARLGMIGTHFENPNGLPDDRQVSTARDLAVLSRAIWREYPQFREMFSIPAIKSGKRVLRTYNTLLKHYAGTNGMKTGFICDSGFNLVASATRGGRTMLVVVLGATSAQSRAEMAASLLDRGFNGINLFKRSLDEMRDPPSQPTPVSMRDEVCTIRRKKEEPGAIYALGPAFDVGKPVVVTTGVPAAASAKKVAAKPVEVTPKQRPVEAGRGIAKAATAPVGDGGAPAVAPTPAKAAGAKPAELKAAATPPAKKPEAGGEATPPAKALPVGGTSYP